MNKKQEFALCLRNEECPDLELRKIYRIIPDDRAQKDGYLRIVDESGDDYLYPEAYFVIVTIPHKAQEALRLAS